MIAKGQDVLVCTNPECKAEFVVAMKAPLRRTNPRCFCGSEMKQAYHSPTIRVLNETERIEVERLTSFRQHSLSIKSI
jgi:hypothetical protein